MAGAGVSYAIIPAEILFRGGRLWANSVTRHTVGVVGLVNHTRGAAWAQDIPAGL